MKHTVFTLFLVVFMVAGCSCKPEVVYKDRDVIINVPVKPKIPECNKGNLLDYSSSNLTYETKARMLKYNYSILEEYNLCLESSINSLK